MKDIDSRLLSVFFHIYLEKSVSKAAETLGLGQPTVSSSLNLLRKHFNDHLFVRIHNEMVATELSEQIFPIIENILSQIDQVSKYNIEYKPEFSQQEFTISMTDISHQILLPKLINRIIKIAPNIKLNIRQIDINTGSDMENGLIDLAIGFIPQLEAGFYQQSLFNQKYVVVCSKDHAVLTQDHISIDEYKKQLHINVRATGGHYILEHALQKQRIDRKILIHLPNYLGVGAVVNETGAVATIPIFLAQTLLKKENLKILSTSWELPSYTVKQHWHSRFHHRASHKWLRETCFNFFNKVDELVF